MNNVLYTAYKLNDSSRKIVKSKFDLSEYKTIYADHQTIEFFGAKNLHPFNEREGEEHKIEAIGYLKTDKLICLVTGKNGEHITVATAEDISPVTSNTEIKEHKDKIIYFKQPLILSSKFHNYIFGESRRKES